MSEQLPPIQESRFPKPFRYLVSMVVGAAVFFGLKEAGASEAVAVAAGILGLIATNAVIGHFQRQGNEFDYPPHRRMDI